ncbi:ER-golgi trafficking TRAPP I complex 85 kDa subunit-domain-containing protein [Chytriomyces sp. MP71]|nr:ER-golgi trafficking TRAPP I complex 85 kDa subunit-domain-containing protein [Chytriomyces sp. MP71]
MRDHAPLHRAQSLDPRDLQRDKEARGSLGARTVSEVEMNCSVLAASALESGSAVPENGGTTEGRGPDVAAPVVDAVLMAEADVKAVETFVREFLVQSLLPSIERSVKYWNEQVASSRRGITGRLVTAGRRYFGTQAAAKAASPGSPTNDSSTPYPHTSQELILRKLADYRFMLRDYKSAYSMRSRNAGPLRASQRRELAR